MIDSFSGANRFLSNFWSAPVTFEGMQYPTVEHAYQAAKTLDISERQEIQGMLSAGKAKQAGRTVTMRPDWDTVKLGVMAGLLHQKFQIPELRQLLTATKGHELIEGNTWGDVFWGKTWNEEEQAWIGRNHLGQLLMDIRDPSTGTDSGAVL